MNGLDIFIIIILLIGVMSGWTTGLLRQVVSIAGLFIGLLVAVLLYAKFGDWLAPCLGTSTFTGRALAFVLLWVGIPLVMLWVAHFLTRAMKVARLGGLNRLGGACICFLKYMLVLSCVLNVAVRLHFFPVEWRTSSRLYDPMLAASGRLFDYCKSQVTHVVDDVVSSQQSK